MKRVKLKGGKKSKESQINASLVSLSYVFTEETEVGFITFIDGKEKQHSSIMMIT